MHDRRMYDRRNVSFWPIATNFSLAPDVSFWGEADLGRAAEFAASVENDPMPTSALQDLRCKLIIQRALTACRAAAVSA